MKVTNYWPIVATHDPAITMEDLLTCFNLADKEKLLLLFLGECSITIARCPSTVLW